MQTSTFVFAALCAMGIGYITVAQDAQAIQKCTEDMGAKLQKIMADVMKGAIDATKMKDHMCPLTKDFIKCALKASSEKRPSEADLEKLKTEFEKSMNQPDAQKIDCGIDISELADEVWNSAGVARPLSLLAMAVTAFIAFFVSRQGL